LVPRLDALTVCIVCRAKTETAPRRKLPDFLEHPLLRQYLIEERAHIAETEPAIAFHRVGNRPALDAKVMRGGRTDSEELCAATLGTELVLRGDYGGRDELARSGTQGTIV